MTSGIISELLYEEIREKRGLAYQMGVSTYHHGPLHEMNIQIASFPEENVAAVQRLVKEIVDSFAVNQQLLEKEKRKKLARYLTQDYTADKIARGAVGELSRVGVITANAEDMERLRVVTVEDMQFVTEHLQNKEQVLRAVVYV